MTNREKLIALLGQCSCAYSPPCTGECGECHNVEMFDDEIANIADHLLANGVTFATDNNVGGKWIPVTERLPKDEANILVCHKNGFVTTNAWLGTHWWFKNEKNPITHWMPLPEPPKEGE